MENIKQICFRAGKRDQDNIRCLKHKLGSQNLTKLTTSDVIRIALETARKKYIEDTDIDDNLDL